VIGSLVVVAALAAVGSAGAAWTAGRRRGAREVLEETARQVTAMGTQRDAAERRAREAQGESARWKGASLAGKGLSSGPVFVDRPAPRDAEELAGLVRGLTIVDDVVLADRSGHPLTRERDATSADLAALAPHVLAFRRQLALAALHAQDVAFETSSAEHVHARPLAGRGEGALLLVRTTSRPVPTVVIDAVVHSALRDFDALPAGGRAPAALTGATDRQELPNGPLSEIFVTLQRELDGHLSAVVLTLDGMPVFSAAKNGLGAAARNTLATELAPLAERAARALRAGTIARIEVTLRDDHTVSWSALTPGSRLAVVALGRSDARSAARLDRLLGTLRRSIDLATTSQLAQGTAA